MRTVIYARFSSQLQNSRSIDQQIAVCQERADREGWPVVEIFTDYAIGGGAGTGEGQRPGLAAMLARIEQGDVEQVLADTTSRVARNQGDFHHIRDRLAFHNVRLFTLGDGEIDRFKGAIKGLLDEQQRVELRHNIKRGQRDTVAQGRAPAGLAYGYRMANRIDAGGRPVRGLREVDPAQAAIVQRIFREISEGASAVQVAKRLNAEKIPGPRGSWWRATTIRGDAKRANGMLRNQLYIGRLIVNRTSKVVEPVSRSTRIRPNAAEEWVVEDVPHLRIVDQKIWDAVQARLADTPKRPEQARRARHLLSGLCVCGTCGGAYIIVNRDHWGCASRREGSGCSNNRRIRNPLLESRVLEGLEAHMLDADLVAVYVKEYHQEFARKAAESRRARGQLERTHAESSRKVDRLVKAIAEGADFEEIRDALESERGLRDKAAAELAELDALPVVALHPNIAASYRDQVRDLRASIADPAARPRAVPALRSLVGRIVLSPNKEGRGVVIDIEGRLNAIVALATGMPAPDVASTITGERVKGIVRYSALARTRA